MPIQIGAKGATLFGKQYAPGAYVDDLTPDQEAVALQGGDATRAALAQATVLLSPTGATFSGKVITATLAKATATGAQWYRDGVAIAGATNLGGGGTTSTYTAVGADVVPGVELTCRFTGLVLTASAGVAAATPPEFVTPPSFTSPPQAGVLLAITNGTASGVPVPSITTVVAVAGVAVALPYTPGGGDAGKTITVIQTATNIGGVATASASATIAAAPPGPVPVNTVLPAISGTPQEGQTLTVTNGTWSNAPTGYTRQWKRGGTNIGAGATTYVVQAGDVGGTITCDVTATNANGSATASSAATATVTAAADTRPRFFTAPANAYNTGTQAYLTGATPLTGSANGGKVGSFNLVTTAGNYGWVAVLASASAAGVYFNDGIGDGGWSGAGQAGNFASGATLDTSTTLFTDSASVQWRLFRQDFVNANPSSAPYTIR